MNSDIRDRFKEGRERTIKTGKEELKYIQTDKLGYLDKLTQFKRMYVTNIMTHILR